MDSPTKSNRFMLFLLIHLCIAPFVILLPIYVLMHMGIVNSENMMNSTMIFFVMLLQPFYCFVLPIAVYLLFTKQRLTDLIPFKRISAANVLLIVGMSFMVQPAMMLVTSIVNLFFDNEVSEVLSSFTSIPVYLMLIVMAVEPALIEEITFRGVILAGYKKMGVFKAALITGLFFGIMHLNPHQFFYGAMLGMVFTYFVFYTGSILSSMLAHFVINASQLIMVYIAEYVQSTLTGEQLLEQTITYNDKILAIQSSAVLFAVTFPVFILLFYFFIKINKRQKFNYINNVTEKGFEIKLDDLMFPFSKHRILDVYLILIFIIYAIYMFFTYSGILNKLMG